MRLTQRRHRSTRHKALAAPRRDGRADGCASERAGTIRSAGATPSSSFDGHTSSAAAIAAGGHSRPRRRGRPTRSSPRLSRSPKATTSPASMSRSPASRASAISFARRAAAISTNGSCRPASSMRRRPRARRATARTCSRSAPGAAARSASSSAATTRAGRRARTRRRAAATSRASAAPRRQARCRTAARAPTRT